ncbi:hypothetical protein TNCV_2780121 [Trichonephila clavipes]|nr:hypothetical protein TNCV_2780121 [Trichonephila clavipes]
MRKNSGVTGNGLHAVSMSSLDARLLWEGGSHEKKLAESPEMDFTPFQCPALLRDFFGRGPTRKKSAESPEMDFTECQRVRQRERERERESATIRGASAFIPRRLAPVFWSGLFKLTQSLCLIGL